MQNGIFQSSAKFMHGKKQNTNLVHLCIELETFALILNSKIAKVKVIDTKIVWLVKVGWNSSVKVIDTKFIHHMHLIS